MESIIKAIVATFVILLGYSNQGFAKDCQNAKIKDLQSQFNWNFYPSLEPLVSHVSKGNDLNKVLFNQIDGWLTLEFFENEYSWDVCKPELTLKLLELSQENLNQNGLRGWDFELAVNDKGNIRVQVCQYGGSRGICHPHFNLVLSYADRKARIVGYDLVEFGLNYPTVTYSINLITGEGEMISTPGIIQDDSDPDTIFDRKIVKYKFKQYYIENNGTIKVPSEIDYLIEKLF